MSKKWTVVPLDTQQANRPALRCVRFLEIFGKRFSVVGSFFGSTFACGAHGIGADDISIFRIYDTRYMEQAATRRWVGAGGSLGPAHNANAQSGVGLSAQINPAYYQEHMRDVIHFRVEAQAVAWAGYKASIKGSHEGL